MTPNLHLEELSKTRNWITFGKALSAALSDPTRYGFDDQSQMLAHVAQLRGVDPSSLRNPLAAVTWMKQNAPKALEEENPKLPMTGVLTLSQISTLSSDLAESLAPKFFSGEVSRRELQSALRMAKAMQGGRGVAAHERVMRTRAFEEQVFQFLQKNPAVLGLGSGVNIVRSAGDTLVPSDFLVVRNGETVAAIECKAHRRKRHRRYLVETLAMTALLAREHGKAFLIVPEAWGWSIAELVRLSEDLRLPDVIVAAYVEGPGADIMLQ